MKKTSNGQLPECRQNLLFNKVSYKELLSLFNLRIICEQSEQQNDTYRRGESGCNINKTSHLEVLREWYRIPIFIVRCTTPAQLTRLVAILRSKMRTASQPLRLLGIPWIPSTVHWTIEPADGSNHPLDGLRSEPRNKKARNLKKVSKKLFLQSKPI